MGLQDCHLWQPSKSHYIIYLNLLAIIILPCLCLLLHVLIPSTCVCRLNYLWHFNEWCKILNAEKHQFPIENPRWQLCRFWQGYFYSLQKTAFSFLFYFFVVVSCRYCPVQGENNWFSFISWYSTRWAIRTIKVRSSAPAWVFFHFGSQVPTIYDLVEPS